MWLLANRREILMSVLNTTVKPFSTQAYKAGKFISVISWR